MDFLVQRSSAGHARVHTLELTELGFSLLGWKDGPAVVLGAVIESCLDDTGAATAEAAALRARRAALPPPTAAIGQQSEGEACAEPEGGRGEASRPTLRHKRKHSA